MARRIEGAADLDAKLRELRDPGSNAKVLRASVREPMKGVRDKAAANIRVVSPGIALRHRTYLGRLVHRGFASRNLSMLVGVRQDKMSAFALLGVKKEAFYAIDFFELGTSKIPRRPWLVPAFASSQSAMLAEMGRVWSERVARIEQRRGGG